MVWLGMHRFAIKIIGIIGIHKQQAKWSKLHLVSYNSSTIAIWNSKKQAGPPKHLFYAITEIEKLIYSNRAVSVVFIL